MLDDTVKAFECCYKLHEPDCKHCPVNDMCGPYIKRGRQKIKDSVRYWLSQVEE